MVKIKNSVRDGVLFFLQELKKLGIPIHSGILFGSCINSAENKWSDIDLIVLSSLYDKEYSREEINVLWRMASKIDSRIEPIPIGLKRWKDDDESTIIEVARRGGIEVKI